jgi:hypothetical protein
MDECPEVTGCIDVDLAFSSSTNMLPMAVGSAIGQEAKVRAAWLRFPSSLLSRRSALLCRIDAATYLKALAARSWLNSGECRGLSPFIRLMAGWASTLNDFAGGQLTKKRC